MAAGTEKAQASLPELTFERVFDAPRELVFKVWTDPYHVAQWWGPHGFAIPVSKVDPRVGGIFEVHMRGEDGVNLPSVGTFHEVVPPSRIVFSSDLEDGNGNKLLEVVNTITLAEERGRTRMMLHIKVLRAIPEVAGKLGQMEMGWSQSLERLENEIMRAAANR